MKQFKNPLLKLEHSNVHGEKMTLIQDENKELWFHHEDCCDDFMLFKKAKFILSEEEKEVIVFFNAMTISINKAQKQLYGNKKK